MVAIWLFHLRSSWMIKPRTLNWLTLSRGWSFTCTGGSNPRGESRRKEMESSLHFFGFNFILFAEAQLEIASKSFWVWGRSFLEMDWDIVMSSTYIQCRDLSWEWLAKSFTIMRNRIGPSFVPCGTPAVTEAQSDIAFPTLTDWVRPDRKLQIHGINDLRTPSLMSLWISMLWSIRSKA